MFNVQWLRFHSSLLNWKSSKCKPIGHLIFVLPVVWIFVKRTHLVHAWFVDLVVNCLFKHMSSWWRGLYSVCRHVCNAFSAFVCSLCLKDILLCNLVKTVQFLMSPGLNYFHLTPIRFTLIFLHSVETSSFHQQNNNKKSFHEKWVDLYWMLPWCILKIEMTQNYDKKG